MNPALTRPAADLCARAIDSVLSAADDGAHEVTVRDRCRLEGARAVLTIAGAQPAV
jgi:hypothetical protein